MPDEGTAPKEQEGHGRRGRSEGEPEQLPALENQQRQKLGHQDEDEPCVAQNAGGGGADEPGDRRPGAVPGGEEPKESPSVASPERKPSSAYTRMFCAWEMASGLNS